MLGKPVQNEGCLSAEENIVRSGPFGFAFPATEPEIIAFSVYDIHARKDAVTVRENAAAALALRDFDVSFHRIPSFPVICLPCVSSWLIPS